MDVMIWVNKALLKFIKGIYKDIFNNLERFPSIRFFAHNDLHYYRKYQQVNTSLVKNLILDTLLRAVMPIPRGCINE